MIDWDRVRIFHAVAEAGSFTKAADRLGLSQSAVSRQIGALEEMLNVTLFHRHARGLVPTEQGEILQASAHEMAKRMAAVEIQLGETREVPAGHLRVNTTVGLGSVWLTRHLAEFLDRYPEITMSLIVTDTDLDLSMREADVAIRLTQPTQQDLVQRRLMAVNTHIYGSPGYLERHGTPVTADDLDHHRLIAYGTTPPAPVPTLNWVLEAGREEDDGGVNRRRPAALIINHVYGMLRAAEGGLGLTSLPDYLGSPSSRLVRVLPELICPTFTAYFVYPEEMRSSKRVAVFRDFLLEKVAEQSVW